MKRHRIAPRTDWPRKVEELGLTYHSHETSPYWDESAYYEFSEPEIGTLEKAATDLHQLCIEAAGAIIENGWWDRLEIPEAARPLIQASWERDDFSLYGRFDLAYDGDGPPKLLEYNADTPTALVEASVAQWFWLQECFPDRDQFNSLHERLIEAWKQLAGERVHFASVKDHPEDEQTALYLQDTCHQAGLVTRRLAIEDLGWNEKRRAFVDMENQKIACCFKLYPWEWMWSEEFAQYLPLESCRFVEPVWKMLLSNKGILPLLWEMFSGHPNLLPAFESPEPLEGSYVQKPMLGREGANVLRIEKGAVVEETKGGYSGAGVIYQDLAPLANMDGHYPVFGLWIVNHEPAALGIREDSSSITTNLSRFVPHLF